MRYSSSARSGLAVLILGAGLLRPDAAHARLDANSIITGIAIAASEPKVVVAAPQPVYFTQPGVYYNQPGGPDTGTIVSSLLSSYVSQPSVTYSPAPVYFTPTATPIYLPPSAMTGQNRAAYVHARNEARKAAIREARFVSIDRNGDGWISPDENAHWKTHRGGDRGRSFRKSR